MDPSSGRGDSFTHAWAQWYRPQLTPDAFERGPLMSVDGKGRPCVVTPNEVIVTAGMRRGELARLYASDVDTEHDQLRVRGTKTAAAKRTIPFDPELRPLLDVLVAEEGARLALARAEGERAADAPLLDIPRGDGKGGAADLTRADLARADLARADLTRDDDSHMPFTFHGLRHTCITHWAVSGKGELFLLTAGGHADVTMTKRYVAAASSVSSKFGTPHPPIPPSLLGAGEPIRKAQESPQSPKTDADAQSGRD